MRITLLRNATLVVEGAEQRLVVDPSLAPAKATASTVLDQVPARAQPDRSVA